MLFLKSFSCCQALNVSCLELDFATVSINSDLKQFYLAGTTNGRIDDSSPSMNTVFPLETEHKSPHRLTPFRRRFERSPSVLINFWEASRSSETARDIAELVASERKSQSQFFAQVPLPYVKQNLPLSASSAAFAGSRMSIKVPLLH